MSRTTSRSSSSAWTGHVGLVLLDASMYGEFFIIFGFPSLKNEMNCAKYKFNSLIYIDTMLSAGRIFLAFFLDLVVS